MSDIGSNYEMSYSVGDFGMVKVDISWNADEGIDVPELPRFGVIMPLYKEFDKFCWYGRGPWENYSDRNTSSLLGIYSSQVNTLRHRYVRPQESGNHTDVRWASLTNGHNLGIKIVGQKPMDISALDVTSEMMDPGLTKKQMHDNDISPDRWRVFLNVDMAQRGVGGDNSWGASPHRQYVLNAHNYSYSFYIIPLN